MKCITKKVDRALEMGNIRCNTCCEYYPCHYKGQNCSFCYCPFYPCEDTDLGKMIPAKDGGIWDCSQCLFNHNNNVVEFSFREFKKLGIISARDPRIKDVFIEAKRSIFQLGKCVMVFGVTSDVSFIVAAICRLLLRRGYVITPFKLQSIYNDPRVTRIGSYISMSQDFQCKAAGLTNISMDVNPIFLKLKNDKVWHVIVNGKNIGKYNAEDYLRNFIWEWGRDIARDSVDFLRKRYDCIIMEGSDFPDSVDIQDINNVNIEMAKVVGASCIFVVDVDNKKNFGDVLCKIEPILKNGGQQIKGIILRTLNKDSGSLESVIGQLERITKIPVIGVVSYVNVFSCENLKNFSSFNDVNVHSKKISVIKFPEASYLSDVSPLSLENVAVEYATNPQNLIATDAIIIPDTKNVPADLRWLKTTGLFDSIKRMAGKIPILGICGGFQIMAKYCLVSNSGRQPELEGLNLIDVNFKEDKNSIRVAKDYVTLNVGDCGKIEGYEIRNVYTENYKGAPLFTIRTLSKDVSEGLVDEERQLYGTHIHGLFERAAFRQYFISKIYADGVSRMSLDYGDYEEASSDQLAEEFFDICDEGKFWGIFERN
ncbi:MAG: cobyric acid synthase [archaeon]|nr:cobyric acid synthase [archaeon]